SAPLPLVGRCWLGGRSGSVFHVERRRRHSRTPSREGRYSGDLGFLPGSESCHFGVSERISVSRLSSTDRAFPILQLEVWRIRRFFPRSVHKMSDTGFACLEYGLGLERACTTFNS